ncbi:MAG: hypothetical protein GY816_00765 [Cytophagales bacterium]|nr:hypothetical protein [Cytophagales bacterium]
MNPYNWLKDVLHRISETKLTELHKQRPTIGQTIPNISKFNTISNFSQGGVLLEAYFLRIDYLIRLFTDFDTVAILFPQHVALAIQLPGKIYGESVLYKGRKYTFFDPTYFNAPLGAVIPEVDKSKAKILNIY